MISQSTNFSKFWKKSMTQPRNHFKVWQRVDLCSRCKWNANDVFQDNGCCWHRLLKSCWYIVLRVLRACSDKVIPHVAIYKVWRWSNLHSYLSCRSAGLTLHQTPSSIVEQSGSHSTMSPFNHCACSALSVSKFTSFTQFALKQNFGPTCINGGIRWCGAC